MNLRLFTLIVFVLLVALWLRPKQNETQVHDTTTQETLAPAEDTSSPEPSLPKEQTLPFNDKPNPPSLHDPRSENKTRDEKPRPEYSDHPTFPSPSEFIEKFKSRPIEEWLKESKPFQGHQSRSRLTEAVALGHDSGIIRTQTQTIEYRYNFELTNSGEGPPQDESCFSLKPKNGDIIFGTIGDGSVELLQLPLENAFATVLKKRHFFIRYADSTESRHRDASGEALNSIHLQALLYYLKQPNGKIVYQGRVEALTSADPNFRLQGSDFCRYSFDEP